MPEAYAEDHEASRIDPTESPVHGYRGTSRGSAAIGMPAGLTIALSREAGARGTTIAKRAGQKLGWDVYSQEMLEYGSQDSSLRQEVLDRAPPRTLEWIDEQIQEMQAARQLSLHPGILELAKLVLALGAQGNVILLGRGAGFILPPRTTLHVRLVAPLRDRIAYMTQWMRLTEEEATEQVRQRDHGRNDFIGTHFHRKPNDVHLYDMMLNTSLLGEDRCADVIAAAARAKMSAFV